VLLLFFLIPACEFDDVIMKCEMLISMGINSLCEIVNRSNRRLEKIAE
jgi:hypothetical protein